MLKYLKLISLCLLIVLLVVACGGDDSSSDSSDSDTTGEAQDADAPPTRTPFPTFEFVAPTNPPVFNQSGDATEEAEATEPADTETEEEAEAETETVELDEQAVSRGLGRYEALDCAVCHGEAGVGTDEIEGLLDYTGTQDEFITFMRTGGTIGNSHQYSTDRLSANGANNLYQYILSITQG